MHRVLVVENERELGDTLTELLRDEGFSVRYTRGIREAREAFATFAPEAVLVDYLLDGETSEAWIGEIVGKARVVLMSASTAPRALADLHSVSFVSKPFDIDELLRLLS
ncbi:MAG: response regulator [Polyangiales bacterium]